MKFLTYKYKEQEKIGVLSKDENKVIALSEVLGLNPNISMIEFIEEYRDEYEEKIKKAIENNKGVNINEVELQSPITVPKRNVICLGKNYKEHVKEVPSAMDFKGGVPECPIYFTKLVNRAVAHGENIPLHSDLTNELDYEVELAVVIGKEGSDIPENEVEDYIFGYTILNDISVRNLQTKHIQWFLGKSLDGTCPMGPYLVHKSMLKFPLELDIKCYVNDELRQCSNTREMIFDIPYIISNISRGLTLKKGDIISTGTPSGVGMGFKPPKFLKGGDVVTCEIQGIGVLRNIVK
ncbi:2-keto-4-pentenoate hydratase/2-oxohepta-3-ene-1,7-dioic acid hydratase (catechol pathway) [Caloramator quimbayensis]|uniref:2-keto-4-pentenoate hydratase/2-oxohepta-3-ene-1,7-dioic acid hydratase (Catechol pathway) n=1 Tax=Caloramator quimbayensis TaxID=1147123 RepID=A0A1T4Y9F7_9CLOT|nr:fumarylacetoacetate hydrolase family protein [Caloramator quimbayensis]SKA98333.1 2-keto-4-pentenoate hydratase/2-oxohepta-3-ene-1,7-dioic acid hydratase (catechol pathway) [Caloramator quimbayensis]